MLVSELSQPVDGALHDIQDWHSFHECCWMLHAPFARTSTSFLLQFSKMRGLPAHSLHHRSLALHTLSATRHLCAAAPRGLAHTSRGALRAVSTLPSSDDGQPEPVHVTIVGGGAAGLTAAFFAAEYGAKVGSRATLSNFGRLCCGHTQPLTVAPPTWSRTAHTGDGPGADAGVR